MQPAKIIPVVLLGGALAWFGTGCASTGQSPGSRTRAGVSARPGTPSAGKIIPSEADLERRARAHAAYAAGLIAQENDGPERSLEFFAQSVADDPTNEPLALEVARRQLERKQGDRALALLRRTVAQPEATAAARTALAFAYRQLGRKDEAIAAFRVALKDSPAELGGYQALAHLLLEKKRPEEALRVLESAARQNVDHAGYWLELAELFAQLGGPSAKVEPAAKGRALAALAKAAALKPEDPIQLQQLGERFEALGEVARAETVFQQLRGRFPRNPRPTALLAEMYLRQGRPKDAREPLEALRREDPINPQPVFYLGVIAFEENDFARAADQFERALLLNAGFEPAYAELAAAQLSQAQPELALATLARAQAKFPADFRREYLAGLAEARLKHYDAASARFQAAAKVARDKQPAALDHRYYFQVGSLLERAGRLAESETNLLKAIELKPDFVEALNYLGYSWADRGIHLARARAMIERAVKAEPDNAAYLDSLGWVLFKLGRPKEAVAPLEKAVRLLPEPDADVLDHLGDALLAAGRRDAARDAWRKAIAVEAKATVQRKLDALK